MEDNENMPQEEQKSAIEREAPEVDSAVSAKITKWAQRIQSDKEHFKNEYKRMREDMQLATFGAAKEWLEAGNYTVPIIKRHINQAVASLYAKNPKFIVEKRRRMNYRIWDGRADTLQAAMESTAQALQPLTSPFSGLPVLDQFGRPMMGQADPNAIAILQEVQEVQQQERMLKRIMDTLEIVMGYFFDEQEPDFRAQLKQAVRRTKTCGVGYIWLAYQRVMQKRPEVTSQLEDVTAQLKRLETLAADLQDGVIDENSEQYETLRNLKADLESKLQVIVREGPVFDFPRSTSIIIDRKCQQISTLVGARWIAREMHLDCDEIKDAYGKDISNSFTPYSISKSGEATKVDKDSAEEGHKACVWEIWDKSTRQTFTIADGYPDYLVAPAAPDVELERFWPLFVITFNDVEHEDQLFPLSEVHDLRHPQQEYNRSRQARRLHRIANKPKYGVPKGRLSSEDKNKLVTHPDSAVLELNALNPNEDVNKLIQVIRPAPIDPALYETNSEMEDVFRTVGSQEANMGGLSGATATEASIGEQSRSVALESNVDDLDTVLTQLSRATAELCLLQLSGDTVRKIAGPGAEWPELTRQEIVEQVHVKIKAGSSGRPNAAADLAKMERGMPYLLQMNGIRMDPVAVKYAELLDFDVDDLIAEGMPSQTALNAMATKMMGGGGAPLPGGGDIPAAQGAAGGGNAPKPPQNEPGPQPTFPAAG